MSGYRKLARGAMRLVWLDGFCAVMFLAVAILNALSGEWLLAAIWCVGVPIWIWCAVLNFQTSRTYDKTADIYSETAEIYRQMRRL